MASSVQAKTSGTPKGVKVASRAVRKFKRALLTPGGGVKPSKLSARDGIMEKALKVASTCKKVEEKEVIVPYRGSSAPTNLRDDHPGYSLLLTEESKVMLSLMGSVWGGNEHRFTLTTALNMSSSGTGSVNSVVAVNAIQFLSSFAALAVVFSEYFIDSMSVQWEPVSLANGPVTFTNSTQVATLPMGVASLQHDAPAYTNLSNMTNHSSFSYHNTGRAFNHRWVNVEKPDSGALYGTESGTTAGYQGWQLVTRSTAYSGQIQFISQSAPPALPATQVLGTFVVSWHVRFRIRQ